MEYDISFICSLPIVRVHVNIIMLVSTCFSDR